MLVNGILLVVAIADVNNVNLELAVDMFLY